VVKGKLGEDPQAGSIFVFANRNATRLKALWFDGNGYCLLYKRLHRAVFELPPSGVARRCSSIRVNWQSCCEAARARRGGKMFEMRSSRLDS
jgi:transposase